MIVVGAITAGLIAYIVARPAAQTAYPAGNTSQVQKSQPPALASGGAGLSSGSKETAGPSAGGKDVSSNDEGKGQSSVTDEITGSLDRTVYWVETEDSYSYHFDKNCRTLSRSKDIKTGTLQDARNAGNKDPCNVCAGGT